MILNAVRLIRSASSVNEASGLAATTLRTTPGPEIATLIDTSGSPLPCSAPAMKGLSSGTLQKVTILAQPIEPRGAVRRDTSSSASAIRITASMLMPALVEATFTEEQTARVEEMASGMAVMSASSVFVNPFWTSEENPPMKSTPMAVAAASRACATFTKPSGSSLPSTWAIGVTEMRRLTIGMPYLRCSDCATGTSSAALATTFS